MTQNNGLKPIAFLFGLLTVACFIGMPFLLIGSPLPIFSIDNKDVNEHKAVIEIFDSTNKSVFKKTYELAPEDRVSQPKPTWLILQLSIPPGDKEEYTVKVILDDNLTKTHSIRVELWNTVDIKIHGYDAESPISMGIESV